MVGNHENIEEEAAILKKIDEQIKNLSPEIRKEAFQILVQRHLIGNARAGNQAPIVSNDGPRANKARSKRSSEAPIIVKDLNLRADDSVPSLRDFWTLKKPNGFLEHNALFAYYLTVLRKIEAVNQNHIYTCYKDVGARVPGAFYQSLLDTARRKGWIDTQDMQNIRSTTICENFVEHDLPGKNVK